MAILKKTKQKDRVPLPPPPTHTHTRLPWVAMPQPTRRFLCYSTQDYAFRVHYHYQSHANASDWRMCYLQPEHGPTLATKRHIGGQGQMGHAKRIWYLSPMRAAKVQASLRIRAVSPEPPLLAHTSSESRGTFRQKARSLAPLNGWACAVEICHDGMLEDTNSLDGAQIA